MLLKHISQLCDSEHSLSLSLPHSFPPSLPPPSPFLSFLFYFLFILCVSILFAYVCTSVSGALGNQKRAVDLLGVKLQTVVSHYVGARNRSWVLCKRYR